MPGDDTSAGDENDKHMTTEAAEDDEVFHWGREVDVNWGMVSWVTLRDQVCRTSNTLSSA
jgi:hypothetical protein